MIERLHACVQSKRVRRALFNFACAGVGLWLIWHFVQRSWTPEYYLGRILEPRAGETQALPEIVNQGIELVRNRQLPRVNFSAELWDDALLHQRFAEGLYPIRLDRGTKYSLVGSRDPHRGSCETIEERPLVALVKCP